MNKSILYLSICGIAACGAAYMSHSYQVDRNEELVRNAKYKAIPNALSTMMMKPTVQPVAKTEASAEVADHSAIQAEDESSVDAEAVHPVKAVKRMKATHARSPHERKASEHE